ncbi:serine hydrolase domain-containing protein [Puia sp. P3]|uniref:serine hydrolase domain-containing protein n=1 Tax=Puia sp. P3 TaxID=3423952 RepID=UPI003D67BDEA
MQARLLLPLIAICATLHSSTAQSVPPQITDRIDSLFNQWNNTSGPGCAIGVVRNDSLIFSKGYGMANLEYGVAITPQTIFHMASVSKQFTAWSILLLERQGKLSLDDDIRKYLNWFPDLKEKITISNLMNHTSGIRDQWELLAIAGTRLDDVITQDQIIKILAKQKALNFKPGTDWSYSNSNFTLLAEIVRSVSGQTLRQFSDSAIFRRLGMKNTHFHDDYTEIVPNRSYSYFMPQKDHYVNAVLSYSTVGATSLFTNIDDMSKWIINFYDHTIGDNKEVQELTEPVLVNGSKVRNYAKGIVADSIYGQLRYQHGGGDAGYQTFVSVFPARKMGFIVFSNLGGFNAQRINDQLAALFIKDEKGTPKNKSSRRDSAQAVLTDTGNLLNYTGNYIADDGTRFAFVIKDHKFYAITPDHKYHLLIAAGTDTSKVFTDTTSSFIFSGGNTGHPITEESWPVGNHLHWEKYDTAAKTDRQLTAYTGTYYCPELDCSYRISLKDHRLLLSNAKYNDSPLTLSGSDHLISDFWWMNHLHITRNAKDQITGFELNGNRVMHLQFVKKAPEKSGGLTRARIDKQNKLQAGSVPTYARVV